MHVRPQRRVDGRPVTTGGDYHDRSVGETGDGCNLGINDVGAWIVATTFRPHACGLVTALRSIKVNGTLVTVNILARPYDLRQVVDDYF